MSDLGITSRVLACFKLTSDHLRYWLVKVALPCIMTVTPCNLTKHFVRLPKDSLDKVGPNLVDMNSTLDLAELNLHQVVMSRQPSAWATNDMLGHFSAKIRMGYCQIRARTIPVTS